MQDIDQISIGQLKMLNPHFARVCLREIPPATYDEWIERLYEDIDDIIKEHVTPNSSYRMDDPEDRFNVDMVGWLKERGYEARHDEWTNGHSDICVTCPKWNTSYRWIGESKIHKDYDHLLEGFKQLTSRYSSGLTGESQGGVIIINRNKDLGNVMTTWKKRLEGQPDDIFTNLKISNCAQNPFSFYSTHNHSRTSIEYKVRHIPASVYFKPIDKSAVNKKS
ncbi:hypothetical protein [Psychrobium sp. 1_MG-2023]|uniref:hypothetical protein n=1 Tax=Psychrobium sp. 1_MG-2023 TaxID=3062624 RepID=UPI000C33650F|nr:hypothetical protein [Psychrobium sp. 1_MG-2023]MDP2561412.1 hypothetical protein [Psychrobium sp. 1_MG-2023]PKF54891.1 hypothetical protein CW748_15200 [Alteromonadales bacterium alter-6D02]